MLMEEFDFASSKDLDSQDEEVSKASMVTYGSKWCKKLMKDAFIPIPYLDQFFEPVEWSHCLAKIYQVENFLKAK